MRKINRPSVPASFALAIQELLPDYPSGVSENHRWEAFRNKGEVYRDVRTTLHANQNGLCAYCEKSLSEYDQHIEHFIPKSLSSSENDHTFTFENFLLSCNGGTAAASEKNTADANQSINSHSCGPKKNSINPSGICLNPYELPSFPVFKIQLADDGIALHADDNACRRASIEPALAESTLDCLNINSPRLRQNRAVVWDFITQEIEKIQLLPEEERQNALEAFAHKTLTPDHPFSTTVLLTLARHLPSLIPDDPHAEGQGQTFTEKGNS